MTTGQRYREAHETATASDTVRLASVHVELAEWVNPYWDALPDTAKLDRALDVASLDGEIRHSHNTTCIELDEYRVRNLDPTTNENQFITELAVGSSGTTPTHADRSLNNEIDRTEVSGFIDSSQTLTSRVFLAKAEGNGPSGSTTLQELGLYAGPFFLNHSLFNSITKTDQKAIVIEVDLTFDAA